MSKLDEATLVVATAHAAFHNNPQIPHYSRHIAQALADAGLLVPDDAKVTTEYGVRYSDGELLGGMNEEDAREQNAFYADEEDYGLSGSVGVVRRTNTTIRSDWQEVADDGS